MSGSTLSEPGFVIPAPDAPWIECLIVDVSDSGVCLDVGALAKLFGLAFNTSGTVVRVGMIGRRSGDFVTATELRQSEQKQSDSEPQKAQAKETA